MINQSTIHALLLCALAVPSVNMAMGKQESQSMYPLKQSALEKYAPMGASAAVIAWQLLSGGPLTWLSHPDWNIPLFQYVKEHPIRTIATLGAVAGSSYFLETLRSGNAKKDPLERKNKGYLVSCAIPTAVSLLLNYPHLNPLIVASVCAVGAAGMVAEIIDNIKDETEVNHVTKGNDLSKNILQELGRDSLQLNKPSVDRKKLHDFLIANVEQVDITKRKTWYTPETMDVYTNVKSRAVSDRS